MAKATSIVKSLADRKAFVALAALLWTTADASALDILPHRASYHASVQIVRGDPSNGAGEGFIEWRTEDHCETWLFDETSLVRMGIGGDARKFSSRQVAFEAKDGSWYRYQNDFDGPTGAEFSSGEAVLDEAGETARVVVEEPESLTTDLPVGTLFPIGFTIDVLERAAAGERFMSHVVFDGTDRAQASEYTTFVESVDEREGHMIWTMKVSVFTAAQHVGPEMEVTASIRDDGVIDAIRYEDDMAITTLTLQELTELPASNC